MNKKLFAVSFLGMAVVGIVVGIGLYRYMAERPTLTAVPVEQGAIRSVVSVIGTVVPEKSAQLGFEQSGKIVALPYEVGSVVRAGATLASLDTASANAALRQAQALVANASDNVRQYEALAKKERAKADSLEKTASANADDKRAQRKQVLASEAQTDAARAQLAASTAGLDAAKAAWRKTRIVAPFSGVILKQDPKEGEIAMPGDTVLVLASQDAFKVAALVSEVEIQNIRVGEEASVSLESVPEQTFSARVVAVDPAETRSGNVSEYKVTLRFTGDVSGLRSGVGAAIDIATAGKDDALVVPKAAIFETNGKKFVHVSHNGISEEREVTTGIDGIDGRTEIISGLQAGDSIFIVSR